MSTNNTTNRKDQRESAGSTSDKTEIVSPSDVDSIDLDRYGRDIGWLDQDNGIEDLNHGERAALVAAWIKENDQIIYVNNTDTFYRYDGGIWRDDGRARLFELAANLLGWYHRYWVERELETIYKRNATTQLDELGTPKGKIATRNHLLDIEDTRAYSLKPEDRALWQVDIEFDPDAECPEWEEFLEDVCKSSSQRKQLQEFVGYALAGGEPWLERALMLLGPTDSGKSTFLDVVEALFGEENNAAQTPQNLANERWGLHQLAGKPVNIRHDVDTSKIQNIGILKEVISGNPVKAEAKNKPLYKLEPITRHLFAANRVPETTVDDEAFWNRWLTVVFPETIPRADQDPQLADHLIEEELPGILLWALDGLERLIDQGQFTQEPSPAEVKKSWQAYGDPYTKFANEVLVEDTTENVATAEVYDAYKRYTKAVGSEIPSQQKVTAEIKKLVKADYGKPTIEGKQQRGFLNLSIDEQTICRIEQETASQSKKQTL